MIVTFILGFLKNRKLLIGIGVAAFLGISVWAGWSEIKSGIYDRGYNAAVQEYQAKLDEAQAQHQEYVIYKLKEARRQAEIDKENTIKRIRAEQAVDSDVETITEYIEKKVYVQYTCDVVPADLNSLFNDSIRSINGTN